MRAFQQESFKNLTNISCAFVVGGNGELLMTSIEQISKLFQNLKASSSRDEDGTS